MKTLATIWVLFLLVFTTGCGAAIPTDPHGALERIKGATMRVGGSFDEGLVERGGAEPTGVLIDLVTAFAARQGAQVEWTWGSEETLVTLLEQEDLDMVVGGFTSDTPWSDRVGVTRGYPEIPNSDGRELAVLVPMGENRLLFELEMYLDEEFKP